jgi:hypothetical protein
MKSLPNFKNLSLSCTGIFLFLISSTSLSATGQLNVTYGAPGELNSKVKDTIVFTFDNPNMLQWSTTERNLWLNQQSTGIGTFTYANIVPADRFGGAGGTGYYVDQATLVFDRPMSYFGLWWGSGSSVDFLDFYSGGELVASFKSTTYLQDLINPSSTNYNPAYLGNPSGTFSVPNTDPIYVWEPFAFVNFFGQNGFTFDEVRSRWMYGFQSDNWTVRDPAYGDALYPTENAKILPGTYVGTATLDPNTRTIDNGITSVPESSTYGVIGLGALALALASRRRKIKSA